MKIKRAN